MVSLTVLLAVVLFTSNSLQGCVSNEQCKVDSLNDYLTDYQSLSDKCGEIYITNTTEALTSIKLRQVPKLTKNFKVVGGISTILRHCFGWNPALTDITIAGNHLLTISSFAFSGLILNELNLTKNNIVNLGIAPFGCAVIKKLDLSYNKIEALQKESFISPVIHIKISRNVLSYIDLECFNDVLQILDLEYNLLYYIKPNYFRNLKNLKKLYLGHNRLIEVNFIDNKLGKLENLDLSYNQLKSLSRITFSSLTNLKYINLTSNQIKSIDTLPIFENLKVLDISLNYLTNFPYKYLPGSVDIFNGFGNPWNCDCFPRMEKYLVEMNVTFNCNSGSNQIPFCISYWGRCNNFTRDNTLIATFKKSINKLIPYCKGPKII